MKDIYLILLVKMSSISLPSDTTTNKICPGNGNSNGSSIEITNGKANGTTNGKMLENGVKEMDMYVLSNRIEYQFEFLFCK